MTKQTLKLAGGDLAVHHGTPEYDYWKAYQQKWEHLLDITTRDGFAEASKSFSNPARIDPAHPHAPASHPLTAKQIAAKKHPATLNGKIVAYAHQSLLFAGSMIYTEDYTLRQELFHRKPGEFARAHADCSQDGAATLHWLGNTKVTPTDFTGTLWLKGKQLGAPRAGCGIIWGQYPGVHFAWITEKVGDDWMTIGFGHQGAPDRNLLSGMNQYFAQAGHPGVRYLQFAA